MRFKIDEQVSSSLNASRIEKRIPIKRNIALNADQHVIGNFILLIW